MPQRVTQYLGLEAPLKMPVGLTEEQAMYGLDSLIRFQDLQVAGDNRLSIEARITAFRAEDPSFDPVRELRSALSGIVMGPEQGSCPLAKLSPEQGKFLAAVVGICCRGDETYQPNAPYSQLYRSLSL